MSELKPWTWSELKPCPFCGSKVDMTYSSWDNMYHIYHVGLGDACAMKEPIDIDGYYVKSLYEAKEAWNRRAKNERTN